MADRAYEDLPVIHIPDLAIVIEQGKVLDFVDGVTQREETPEEYVRQEIAKSLVREYGYSKQQLSIEFGLRIGTRRPRADILIFDDGDPHQQHNARIVIECKSAKTKPSARKDGVGQLQSYMAACRNVVYGMWTNGQEKFCYRAVTAEGKVQFEEIPDVPVKGRSEDEVERPKFDQLRAASSDALLFAFRRCHNYIAGNQGLPKPEAFWELLKLIFCKIHDERSSNEVLFYATAAERHNLTGQMRAQKRIEALFSHVKKEYPTIFRPSESIELNTSVLPYIVSQLQMYSLLESDIDVKGRAYEEVVGSNLRGDRGEFFTPRNVCQMAVEMLDPAEGQLIVDPACGTGGFLITAMNYVIEKIRAAETKKWGDVERAETAVRQRIQRFASTSIVGMDFNPDLVKASKMNMVMNNDGAGGLHQANSLKSPATWDEALRARNIINNVDLVFTNPPFGSKIPVDDPSILEQYDLGHTWTYDEQADQWNMSDSIHKSQPPEILFIERCIQLLKPGSGRAAIVVPDGILGGPGLGYVREWIQRQCQVLGSIDLHPDTFQPGVSIQTSVLLVKRKSAELIQIELAAKKRNEYEVFMAVANHIGHDRRGNVTYVRDDRGNEIVEKVITSRKEYENGRPVYIDQITQRKVVDDNTLQIAQAFRKWLKEQD